MKNKALFIDLDHTLVRPKSGGTFPKDATDWEFLPGIIEKLTQWLSPYAHGFTHLIVITNQGGIEMGYQTDQEVRGKLRAITAWTRHYFPHVTSLFYYCPTMEGKDRKPNPGMINCAVCENEIDLNESIMVGDMESDRQCAENAGVRYLDVNRFLQTWPTVES